MNGNIGCELELITGRANVLAVVTPVPPLE